MQLHIPYSEHAKVPVGPITMGLSPAMDPKKLGKDWGLPIWVAQAWLWLPLSEGHLGYSVVLAGV